MIITKKAAKHAADMLAGIVAHPFWHGIDREKLQMIIDALNSEETIEFEHDPLPNWGIPGDEMIFLNHGGGSDEHKLARRVLEEGQRYTIAKTSIGGVLSRYEFVGVEGCFNTVMFDYADPAAIRQAWIENRAARQKALNAANSYLNVYSIYGEEKDV